MSIGKRKRKDGSYSWFIQYSLNGKRVTETIPARTERQARIYEAKRLAEIEQAKFWNEGYDPHITFEKWCCEYLEIKKAQDRKTLYNMKIEVRRFIEYFGNRTLNSINTSDLEKYLHQRKQQNGRYGGKLKQATINREIARLKNLFEEAVRNKKIQSNPARHIKLQSENNERTRILSMEEYETLLENLPDHLKDIVLLAFNTGMRRGEILGLKWENVNLKERKIVLTSSMTKTQRQRTIPLNDELAKMLDRRNKIRHLEHNYVFHYKDKPIKEFKHSFTRACKLANIENFRFHDLRHTFVTNARKAGIHDHVIMAVTGHSTRAMFRRYDSVTEEDLSDALGKLENEYKVQRICSAKKKPLHEKRLNT